MPSSTELRDTILREARALFALQGYAATSIKQIATAAGCTTAALYYYFEDGKSQILRDVVRSYVLDITQIFDAGKGAESLEDFLTRFTQSVARGMPEIVRQINWLMLEFRGLQGEEKHYLQQQLLSLHTMIATEVARFVKDQTTATNTAWLIFCAMFGYEQLFITMEIDQVVPLGMDTFTQHLAQVVKRGTP